MQMSLNSRAEVKEKEGGSIGLSSRAEVRDKVRGEYRI